jgi:hypothetical protein
MNRKVKISRKHLRSIIDAMQNDQSVISEKKKVALAPPDEVLASAAEEMLDTWNRLRDPEWKGSPEQDPAVRKFIRSIWDNSNKPGWTNAKKLTTVTAPKGEEKGTAKQFSDYAWSAVTVGTAQCKAGNTDKCPGSIRHSDYWEEAEENRKIFDEKGPESVKGKYVAFDREELMGNLKGALAMNKRKGGTHGDICIDSECDSRIGGNVNSSQHSADDLAIRGSGVGVKAPKPERYLVKSPGKPWSGTQPTRRKWSGRQMGPMPESKKRMLKLAGIKKR